MRQKASKINYDASRVNPALHAAQSDATFADSQIKPLSASGTGTFSGGAYGHRDETANLARSYSRNGLMLRGRILDPAAAYRLIVERKVRMACLPPIANG